jgi:arylsulfatase A-like enzyme
VPLPPNFGAAPGPAQPLKARLLRELYFHEGHSRLPLRTEAEWRRLIANYWGLCSLVDTHIGTILDTLDVCGLRDNTIVVFTSDHGDMMGAHQLLAKCVLYQEAIRVPLLLRLPGQRAGRRVYGPVSQIDLVPTLLDLLGAPAPTHLQGRSQRPALYGKAGALADTVFLEWNGPNNGMEAFFNRTPPPAWVSALADPQRIEAANTDPVRTAIAADGWKLNCSPLGEHELYNLAADPLETTNVFGEHKPVARRLREEIRDWQARTGDAVTLPDI